MAIKVGLGKLTPHVPFPRLISEQLSENGITLLAVTAVWGSTYWVDNKVFIATEEGDVWVLPHGKGKPDAKPSSSDVEQLKAELAALQAKVDRLSR